MTMESKRIRQDNRAENTGSNWTAVSQRTINSWTFNAVPRLYCIHKIIVKENFYLNAKHHRALWLRAAIYDGAGELS